MVKKAKLAKTLKTLTSDITGEELVLKLNNAVWLILQNDFDITQANWNEEFLANEVLSSLKLIVAVLKANGYHYTLEEIAENTDQMEVLNFMIEYQKTLFGSDEVSQESNDDEGK